MGQIGTGLQVTGLASQVFGAYSAANAEKDALKYQSQVNDLNARMADMQAKDALERGNFAERNARMATRQQRGAQVASMAARGLDISEGSALNILTDTDYFGEQDALIIRDNAAKEAWGYRQQGRNYRGEAELLDNRSDAISPFRSSASTLLTGAGNVASSWYRFNNGVYTSTGA